MYCTSTVYSNFIIMYSVLDCSVEREMREHLMNGAPPDRIYGNVTAFSSIPAAAARATPTFARRANS